MTTDKLNYDQIASQYNQRYPESKRWERGETLLDLARQTRAKTILEVGSGTGYWLNLLGAVSQQIYGLDYSIGMIGQAKRQPQEIKLAQGSGTQLPYRANSFDLVYCVDAIHHFGDHRAFVKEAARVLNPGGTLAIIGHDPHERGLANWYIYNYFEGVYDRDLRRYPAERSLMEWMEQSGFLDVSSKVVENIQNIHVGESVLKDPFLKHNATSQLALLSEQEYESGMRRIKQEIARSKAEGGQSVFRSEFPVKMTLGRK